MRIASIGECMLELSTLGDDNYSMAYGGDTLNTAVYLARLGVEVDYVTALGDDPLSKRMVEAWRAEGVGTRLVLQLPGHSRPLSDPPRRTRRAQLLLLA